MWSCPTDVLLWCRKWRDVCRTRTISWLTELRGRVPPRPCPVTLTLALPASVATTYYSNIEIFTSYHMILNNSSQSDLGLSPLTSVLSRPGAVQDMEPPASMRCELELRRILCNAGLSQTKIMTNPSRGQHKLDIASLGKYNYCQLLEGPFCRSSLAVSELVAPSESCPGCEGGFKVCPVLSVAHWHDHRSSQSLSPLSLSPSIT